MNLDIHDEIDLLMESNPKEAEQYMLGILESAKQEGDFFLSLALYNELIGYYRQISDKDNLLQVIDSTKALLEKLSENETVMAATSMLNIANAYRSISMLELAKEYYDKTEQIYVKDIQSGRLSEYDVRVAGLYNNQSLLFQELGDYKTAESLQKKALFIVLDQNEKFEIAVTYANLANTMLLAKDYEASYAYAKEAISRFKARNIKDPHLCAAMSAVATCYYNQGNVSMAKKIYEEAMNIVETTIGRNSQYDRLREYVARCENNPTAISGMELSKKYFEEYGQSILKQEFAGIWDHIAVGLVGEGSDCYGYDDALSSDHDAGPGFCIWLDDEISNETIERLSDAYDNLPTSFMGALRNETSMGKGRRGVIRTSDFYKKFIGTDNPDDIDYSQVEDYALAACTNGVIFVDGNNSRFTSIRNALKKGYPASIRLKKLASDVAQFSQNGQYNFLRMLNREDDFTASIHLSEFCKTAMKLYHHIKNCYPPHDKWLKKSTLNLDGGDALICLLEKVTNMYRIGEKRELLEAEIEKIGKFFASIMYDLGDISDIDSYLEHHVGELLFKSTIIELDDKELVDKIARIEFSAFDKVKNEGGRASCQNDWPTFSVMRKSQYLTWNHEMLVQYLYDFTRELDLGHNLITEKYGRMMKSTAPDKYDEIKEYFPFVSKQKEAIIEQVVALQMNMLEEFGKEFPKLANNTRSFHTYEDNIINTSYETYLRGEITTYSDKMLQLYAGHVIECINSGVNIAKETISNTAKLYGYSDIYAFNESV